MKPAARGKAPQTGYTKKPVKRWLKNVCGVLEKWAEDSTDLTLIFGGGFSAHLNGRIRLVADRWFSFFNEAGVNVSLMPDLWDLAKVERRSDQKGMIMRITYMGSELSITDSDLFKMRKLGPIEPAIYQQLELWAKLAVELNIMVYQGFYATAGRMSLRESSPEHVWLYDEKAKSVHVISLKACRYVHFRRDREFCAITFIGEGSEPSIEISDTVPQPKDLLSGLTVRSERVH